MSIIVAASKNQHKIKEIEAITKEFGMEIIPGTKPAFRMWRLRKTGARLKKIPGKRLMKS